ncbi:MAG: hypothetical protein BGO67_06110 [Alphaproteobacteria bacterium 41-28]|nr:MAG: hypothetical protein BGO67_06110 [Alphaproteobacteria bacterium 41-28]
MKKCLLNTLILFTAYLMFLSQITLADNPYICKSQYALCTTAKCSPIPGQTGLSLCFCKTETGYSAGEKPCQDVKTTPEGYKEVRSRYYPIGSYVSCSNARPWANCLDSPCIIDPNDPSKAVCTCSIVKNQGPYVIVTDTCNKSGCETGLTSSATVKSNDELDTYIRSSEYAKDLPAPQKKLCGE